MRIILKASPHKRLRPMYKRSKRPSEYMMKRNPFTVLRNRGLAKRRVLEENLKRQVLEGNLKSHHDPDKQISKTLVRKRSTFFITVDQRRLKAAYQPTAVDPLPQIRRFLEILSTDQRQPEDLISLRKIGLTVSNNKPSRKLARINKEHNICETLYLDVFHLPLVKALGREEKKKCLFSLLNDHLLRFLTNTSRSETTIKNLQDAGIVFKLENL